MGWVDSNWSEHGYGRVVIVDRTTGRLLGRTGLAWLQDFGEVELGWTVRHDAWGYGYATEAAGAVADWAFSNLNLDHLVSLIEPTNQRSGRIAERLGMSVVRADIWHERAVAVHSVTQEQYEHRGGESPIG